MRLFVTCWLVYGLHFATNTVREIYPALSLGDHLSFDVGEYAGLHPDTFELEGRGTFINNNPGASILGAVPYAIARPIIDRVVERVRQSRAARGDHEPPPFDSPWPMAREFFERSYEEGYDIKFGLAAGVMQVGLMAPLSALAVVVMFQLLRAATGSARAALWLALLYAFATPVFFRTAQLNQNLLVAHCALFAFAALWRPSTGELGAKRPLWCLAGLLCGWAVVCDYSGVVVVAALGLYAVLRRGAVPAALRKPADLWRFAVGAALTGSVLALYQWVCFGHPLYPAQHYMPAATYTHHGYVGMDWPKADLFWDTLFSPRFGLLVSAPLLVMSLYVPAWRARSRVVGSAELWCILFVTVAFLLFCSANQYGRMQFNSGVRHVVPITPFLFLLAAGALLRLPLLLAGLVGVVATWWSWCLAMYREVELGTGVLDAVLHITLGGFRLPWLTTLERMGAQFPGLFDRGVSALPLFVLLGACLSAIWLTGRTPTPPD